MNRNMTQEGIDRIFIQDEDKDSLPHTKLKLVSYDTLCDFKSELERYLNYMLHDACMDNNCELLKEIISMGPDINKISFLYGITPLENACAHNSYECARLLIELGALIKGFALFLSYSHESSDCIKLLLDRIKIKSVDDKFKIIIEALEGAKINNNKQIADLLFEFIPADDIERYRKGEIF